MHVWQYENECLRCLMVQCVILNANFLIFRVIVVIELAQFNYTSFHLNAEVLEDVLQKLPVPQFLLLLLGDLLALIQEEFYLSNF